MDKDERARLAHQMFIGIMCSKIGIAEVERLLKHCFDTVDASYKKEDK